MKNLNIDFSNLKGDLFGGITAGIVALPLALAFGVQSGMGAAAGLYGAIIVGIMASVFGGTASQISGPTGPMTVVSALIIATAIETTGSLQAGMGIIIATFFLAGGFQIVFGLIKIGKYVKYIPYPVISGFMSGIGVIIILLQVFPMFGHESPKKIIEIFTKIEVPLSAINLEALLLTLMTIAVIYLFPKITRAIPSTLVALLAITLVPVFIPMDVPVIGDIPSGIPALKLNELADFNWSHLSLVLIPAITLAALGAIDSLLTSVVADNITKTKHQSNKELIGQGMGNMLAAIFGGIPGAGATMRTVVNVKSGGATRISGVVHGVLLLIILLGAGSYAAKIPLPVLAGILITVGIGIIDYRGLKHIAKVPKADAAIMLIVLLATVFIDLLQAVAIGVVLASVLFMKKMGDMGEIHTETSSFNGISNKNQPDTEVFPEDLSKQVFVKHLYGPLFFGFTSKFQELSETLSGINLVIIRMERVPFIDQSGLYALEEVILNLKARGIIVGITGLQPQPADQLKKVDFIPRIIDETNVFTDFDQCSEWIKNSLVPEHELSDGGLMSDTGMQK